MSPILTAALTALRAGFDQAFPNRDHTSDGWIGDTAHQAEVSGHNPDDTPGVRAEYSDPDSIPEVRAIDVDADLNEPGITMMDVIDRILATPNDLVRLKYIIHNYTIWSKSRGWQPAPYTGASPHTEHAHFSGDPLYDEIDSEWSVATMGDNVSVNDVIVGLSQLFDQAANRSTPDGRNFANDFYAIIDGRLAVALKPITDQIAALAALVQGGLPPETVADLKAAIAAVPEAVVNEEAARLTQ